MLLPRWHVNRFSHNRRFANELAQQIPGLQRLRLFASSVQAVQRGRGSHFPSAHDLVTAKPKLMLLSLLLPVDLHDAPRCNSDPHRSLRVLCASNQVGAEYSTTENARPKQPRPFEHSPIHIPPTTSRRAEAAVSEATPASGSDHDNIRPRLRSVAVSAPLTTASRRRKEIRQA